MYDSVVGELTGLARRAHERLTQAGIPYQIIGGFGVFLHVRNVSEDNARQLDAIKELLCVISPKPRRKFQLFPVGAPMTPESIDGLCVAPVAELLHPCLVRNRLKDMTHVRDLLDVGLITQEMEAALPSALRERLELIKAHE